MSCTSLDPNSDNNDILKIPFFQTFSLVLISEGGGGGVVLGTFVLQPYHSAIIIIIADSILIMFSIRNEQRNCEILKLLQIYKNDQKSKFMLTYMLFKIFL